MEYDFAQVSTADRYKLMGSSILPRPIAWVTTRSAACVNNAAPYSFFNMMSAEPPLIALGMMRNADGTHKDSAANILETEEFVVNLVRYADAPAMNFTCIDAPPQFDEAERAGLILAPSSAVRPDRIASAPVSMECRLHQAVEVAHTTIVLGQVLRFHIADELIDADRLYVDSLGLDLVARMHGSGWYTRSTDLFQMDRPVYAQWQAMQEHPVEEG